MTLYAGGQKSGNQTSWFPLPLGSGTTVDGSKSPSFGIAARISGAIPSKRAPWRYALLLRTGTTVDGSKSPSRGIAARITWATCDGSRWA